jgi:hypothetical protein
MENSKRACGILTLNSLGRVLDKVEMLHVRLHPVTAHDADEEGDHDNGEAQSIKGFACVEPFGNEMDDGDDTAALMEDEIAMENDLSSGTGIFQAEKAFHFGREKGGTDRHGEENGGTKPDRSIDDSNKA